MKTNWCRSSSGSDPPQFLLPVKLLNSFIKKASVNRCWCWYSVMHVSICRFALETLHWWVSAAGNSVVVIQAKKVKNYAQSHVMIYTPTSLWSATQSYAARTLRPLGDSSNQREHRLRSDLCDPYMVKHMSSENGMWKKKTNYIAMTGH